MGPQIRDIVSAAGAPSPSGAVAAASRRRHPIDSQAPQHLATLVLPRRLAPKLIHAPQQCCPLPLQRSLAQGWQALPGADDVGGLPPPPPLLIRAALQLRGQLDREARECGEPHHTTLLPVGLLLLLQLELPRQPPAKATEQLLQPEVVPRALLMPPCELSGQLS